MALVSLLLSVIGLPALDLSSDQYEGEARALPPCSPLGPALSCRGGGCALGRPGCCSHSCSLNREPPPSHPVTVLILSRKPICTREGFGVLGQNGLV